MELPDVSNRRETPWKAPRSPGAGTLTCPAYAPGSAGLPSSPIQALRGGRILITTKNLSKDPLPYPRRTRSPHQGSSEPLQKAGDRGERRGDAAPPASPRGSAGARRGPVAKGPSVRKSSTSSPAGTEARRLRGSAGRPLRAGETKENETKRKKTKKNERKHRRSQYRAAHPAPRYRGPGPPTRVGPVRPDRAWRSQAAGPDPVAAKRAFPRANECRTGWGELGRPAD